jgi:hypothetical protein
MPSPHLLSVALRSGAGLDSRHRLVFKKGNVLKWHLIVLGLVVTLPSVARGQVVAVSALELQKMKDFVGKLNADPGTARKSLKRYNNQIVDCVDYAKQPAFRELNKSGQPIPPLATLDRPLPNAPQSSVLADPLLDVTDAFPTDLSSINFPKSCDPGTVPILRTELAEIIKYGTLAKYTEHIRHVAPRASTDPQGFFHAGIKHGTDLVAIQANINLQAPPRIGAMGDHETLQLCLAGLTTYTDANGQVGSLNTVEIGLDVDPKLYGETQTNYSVHTFFGVGSYNYHNWCMYGTSGCYTEAQYLYWATPPWTGWGVPPMPMLVGNPTYHQQSSTYFPSQGWVPKNGAHDVWVQMGIVSGGVGPIPVWCFVIYGQIIGYVYKWQMPPGGMTDHASVGMAYGEVYSTNLGVTNTAMGTGNFAETYVSNTAAWMDHIQDCSPDVGWQDFAIYSSSLNACRAESPQCYDVRAYSALTYGSAYYPCNVVPPDKSPPPHSSGTFMYVGGPGSYNNSACHN